MLFLWLAGLLFFAHGITPHHHHFDSVFGHSQQTESSKEHAEDSPVHCHAFNDLAIIKAGVSSIAIANDVPSDIIVNKDMRFRYNENPSIFTVFREQDFGFPDDMLLRSSPTRGSPANSRVFFA